jgi:hypothetical protein
VSVTPVIALAAGAVALLALPILSELRIKRPVQALTGRWQHLPIEPRDSTLLGISFRSPQVDVLGLDARATLQELLTYPFQLLRLAAYWNRLEPEYGRFRPDELDWQVDAAERAGKQIIICVGPVKAFSYPEFFVPDHQLPRPLREGALVTPSTHGSLLAAGLDFVARVVDRYKDRKSIVAWQVEHEAVDPLGVEHSWRLAAAFVEKEVAAVRELDPTRPIMMNGFLPTSLPVRLQQWWRTRDQGDSLAVAQRLADVVGIDFYPRHALVSVHGRTLYLDGSRSPWQSGRRKQIFAWVRTSGRRLMISEGQAEPWETVTIPPNPSTGGMFSCMPEQVIDNYNQCITWARLGACPLYAYLFWGAEYWMLRQQSGDLSYITAFRRILDNA